MKKLNKYALLFISLISVSVFAQKSVKMSASATEMFKTDVFDLEIILENFESEVSVQYPQFNDLTKISGPFQSSSTSIINGKMSKSITLSYQFAPKRTGKITIEPVVVIESGKNYRSNEITVNVIEQGQSSGASDSREMFIVAEISSKDIYVGEMVRLDYTLYIKPEFNLSLPSLSSEPKFTNFVKDQIEYSQEKATRLTQTIYKGQKYNTLPLRSYWLTPTSSGDKVIDPLSVIVPIEVKTKKRKSPFGDPFFDDDIFNTFKNYNEKNVLSEDIKVKVNPMPAEGKPSDFNGAVGSFNLNTAIDNDSVAVNDAVTMKIIISGKGNLNDINLPQPVIPKDFEVYDPKRTVQLDQNSKNTGNVIFEYLLLARTPGRHTINKIPFSFFDTKEKKYKTLYGKEYSIIVTGSESAVSGGQRPSAGYSRRDIEVLASDIRYIKKSFNDMYPISEKKFQSGKFLISFFISVIMIISSFFIKLYFMKNLQNSAAVRRKKAVKNANKRLKNSYKALESNDLLKFYKTLDEALLKFIADKFNISHAGIISDEIIERLKEKGVEDSILNDLKDLLMKSASIQFAPSKPDSREMSADIEKARNLMSGLNERLK